MAKNFRELEARMSPAARARSDAKASGMHAEYVQQRMKKSARFRRAYARYSRQIDLAMLVREMREAASLTQAELAQRAGTTQSAIARLEDAEYTAHSLQTIEKIAQVCGVELKLHAHKKPKLELEVSLV